MKKYLILFLFIISVLGFGFIRAKQKPVQTITLDCSRSIVYISPDMLRGLVMKIHAMKLQPNFIVVDVTSVQIDNNNLTYTVFEKDTTSNTRATENLSINITNQLLNIRSSSSTSPETVNFSTTTLKLADNVREFDITVSSNTKFYNSGLLFLSSNGLNDETILKNDFYNNSGVSIISKYDECTANVKSTKIELNNNSDFGSLKLLDLSFQSYENNLFTYNLTVDNNTLLRPITITMSLDSNNLIKSVSKYAFDSSGLNGFEKGQQQQIVSTIQTYINANMVGFPLSLLVSGEQFGLNVSGSAYQWQLYGGKFKLYNNYCAFRFDIVKL